MGIESTGGERGSRTTCPSCGYEVGLVAGSACPECGVRVVSEVRETARGGATEVAWVDESDDALIEFLTAHDVECPGCGYQLRGLRGPACPECGRGVSVWELRPKGLGGKSWRSAVIGTRDADQHRRNMARWSLLEVVAGVLVVGGIGALVWVVFVL